SAAPTAAASVRCHSPQLRSCPGYRRPGPAPEGLPAPAPAAAVATPVPVATAPGAFLGRTEVAELLLGLLVPGGVERRAVANRRLAGATVAGALGPVAVSFGTGVFALLADQRERQLALVVDVVDPNRDLVAELEHVLDAVDALAPTELRDVQQAVT